MLEMKSIINLTGNRNRYFVAREKLAVDIFRMMHGRVFSYSIPEICDDTGICIIESITYDRLMDKFIYVIKDCDTNHVYITERCNLCLIEID